MEDKNRTGKSVLWKNLFVSSPPLYSSSPSLLREEPIETVMREDCNNKNDIDVERVKPPIINNIEYTC